MNPQFTSEICRKPVRSGLPISAQNRTSKEQKLETGWKRPKGMYFKIAQGRPKPFLLGWAKDSQSPIQWQSFPDETARLEAAMRLGSLREDYGKEIANFDPREWRRWVEFKEAANGHDPMEILREWRVGRGDEKAADPITVSDAVDQYLAFRFAGELSPDTRRHFENHLRKRFAVFCAGMKLRDVTDDTINRWLASLRSSKGAGAGGLVDPLTRRHHRKDLNTFLQYCVVTKGWLGRNPCAAVAVPQVEEEDVALLTPEEGRALFEKNAGNPVLGRLALEAFGFLRASSAGRISKADLNFDEKGIRMPAPKHKSKKTKYRQGHPDNLWAFLNAAGEDCWKLNEWQYRNEKIIAFRVAGIGNSENRLRKTCISAHLAWLKNQPLTSYLAQHRHQSTTDIYVGVMSEAAGKQWFSITP